MMSKYFQFSIWDAQAQLAHGQFKNQACDFQFSIWDAQCWTPPLRSWWVRLTFNSLFEMHVRNWNSKTNANRVTFNSLFEMPFEAKYLCSGNFLGFQFSIWDAFPEPSPWSYWPSVGHLSILYLRCAEWSDQVEHMIHCDPFNSLFEMLQLYARQLLSRKG